MSSDKTKRTTNNYLRDAGELSRSGKSIIKITKSGRKYYAPANQIKKEKRDPSLKGLWLNRKDDISTRIKPICSDKLNEAYMRYWDKKCEIRNQYPKWVFMSREQCREYYSKIWDLMQWDEDWKQWKEETKPLKEKNDDLWWQEKRREEEDYDGHNDEYDWN